MCFLFGVQFQLDQKIRIETASKLKRYLVYYLWELEIAQIKLDHLMHDDPMAGFIALFSFFYFAPLTLIACMH